MTDTTTAPTSANDPAPQALGIPGRGRRPDARPSATRLTYTVEEAGELIGVSRGTAYRFVREGVLRSVHPNRRWLVPAAAIDEFLSGDPPAARHR